MHANSSEKEKAKNMLSDYFKEFTLNTKSKDDKVDFKNKIKKILKNCDLYKLKNLSTFIAYNAIKYFYQVICTKGKDQLGFNVSDYELEEVEKGLNYSSDVDTAYKIIHSRSYVDVLFSIAESYNNKHCSEPERNMAIICKRLKLKSEIEDSKYNNGKIESKFFLPGFLPIYATIPDPFKEIFEDDYLNMKNNIFKCASCALNGSIHFYAKDLKLIALLERSLSLMQF